MKKPSIAFFGTPRFAVFVLEELERAGYTPDVIVTQPDKPAGRGLALTAPPVKPWGEERGIPVLQDNLDLVQNSDFDLFIVAAYGKILPMEILKLPAAGTLNVHPSLLPRYRGPSPVESQILADDRETGVSIMLIDEEVDHGPIVAQASVTPETWPLRASVLEEILARAGGELLAETLVPYMGQKIAPEPQDHAKATFTKKIEKEDGLLEIRHRMSDFEEYQKYLKFCAYDGWPGTYFFKNDKRIKITDATYEGGTFTPTRVIPEGKKEMSYADFSRER